MYHEKGHPKDRANFLSKVLLWWIVDVLWRGNKTPLNQEDLDPVREEDGAARCTKLLEEIWRNEKISAGQQKKAPKLWKAMIKYFTWKEHAFVIFVMLLNVFGNALNVYSITNLMKAIGSNFEQDSHSPNEYLIFIWVLIIGVSCETLGSQHSCLVLSVLGIKARAALVGLIYKKVLKCSKMSLNAGEVMELVCDDSQRLVTMAAQFLPNFVRQSAKLLVYLIWLFYLIGWRFLPGLFVFTILATFRVLMTNVDINYRRKASDLSEKRLGYLREVLTIIHSVKLNCLEHVYEAKINKTRWQEIKYKAKRWVILSISFSFTLWGQLLSPFVTVMVFIHTDRSMLTFGNLFTIMLLSVGIGSTIGVELPVSVHYSTDVITGIFRIQRFLDRFDGMDYMMKELPVCKNEQFDENSTDDKKSLDEPSQTPNVWLDRVSCRLLSASNTQTKDVTILKDISIQISSNGLVIITGSVGSGKSSLLSSILHGELHITKGSIQHSGSIAYVSDTPWVFPGTVRENILFGSAYDEEWYLETIKACQLERDFNRFPEQDLSHVGENGATLSGGQRTRVALARAVYSRADIYLLDDPFSSLDAKVAESIFQNVFKGMLSERIVLLVTHNPRYLAQADYIIKLTKGMVVARGTVEEVKEKMPEIEIADIKNNMVEETDEGSKHMEVDDDVSQTEQLCEAQEDRQVGNVSFKVYSKYFMFGAPALVLFLIFTLIVVGQGLTVWVDIQVSLLPNIVNQEQKFHHALTTYSISMIMTILIVILARLCNFLLPIRANYKLHNKMVNCLLQAPTYFYAVNPAGRILNRFSQDINNLDDLQPYNMVMFVKCVTPALGAIVLCTYSNIYLIPVCLIGIGFCCGISKFFYSAAMDIKRLMSESGGPLYSHFSNTMEGVRTIRVNRREKSFTESAFRHIDHQHATMFAYYTAARWFGITLDLVLSFCTVSVALFELYSGKDSSGAVVAAVAFMYAYRSTRYTTAMVRTAVEINAQMTSAERILAYTEIVPEKGRDINEQPPKEWPESGRIEFKNVSLRHYKEGPKVLKDLSFQIHSSEKIGIVGRTGAGKSSLVAALMRIGKTEGSIIIDNLSIQDLNVLGSRQRISVISQSPVLFTGSIKENLDPTGKLDESELWEVLDLMKLGILVGNLPDKLQHECTGGGSNFSVGQRQLFHLARVLLKRNKVVIFDEATGKVDKKTAEQIQEVLHSVFKDCTVLTISHRLSTIQECDRIMVLDQGLIVEFDKPDVLLNKKKGMFLELTNIANEA